MAKRINTVTVTIEASQARKEMDDLRERSEALGKTIRDLKNQRDSKNLKKTSEEWLQIDRQIKEATKSQKELDKLIAEGELKIKGVNDVLSDMSKSTYNELIRAQRQLLTLVKSTKPNTKEYAQYTNQLRDVNKQLDDIRGTWKETESGFSDFFKNVAGFLSIGLLIDKLKDFVSGSLELSDAMADVQKTTGLAGEELRKMSSELDGIDTRSSQQELHELAAVAGQMGMTSREQVVGFVKAANQLNVALDELGADGVGNLTKVAMLTGELDRLGVEKSLLAIGSSINALSAASPAAAGPIAEFIRRTGSIAPVANLATSDLAALGATADALGQTMEVSGTAMNKFISAVVNNTDGIAYALNIEAQELRDLIDTGQTMEAIIKVLEAVKNQSELSGSALGDVFKEFGSEGERMTRVIQAMSEKTDFLRSQVELSAKSFEDATSVTDEYNVKNETAAALVERIGNMWREFFVNSESTNIVTKILESLLKLSEMLTGTSNKSVALQAALISLGTAMLGLPAKITKFIKAGRLMITSIAGATTATGGLTAAWKTLSRVFHANPIGLAIGALTTIITGVTYAVSKWNQESKELEATQRELLQEELREVQTLDALKKEIDSAAIGTEDRAAAIRKLNEQYGDYLGYVIDEKASVEELSAAYELLAASITLSYTKRMESKLMEKPLEEYVDNVAKHVNELRSNLSDINTHMGQEVSEIEKDIRSIIDAMAQEETSYNNRFEVIAEIRERFTQLLNEDGTNKYTGKQASWLSNNSKVIAAANQLYKDEKGIIDARVSAAQKGSIAISTAEKAVSDARANVLKEQEKTMNELIATPTETLEQMSESQLKSHYERILNYGNALLDDANQQYADYVAKNKKLDSESDDEYTQRLLNKKNELTASLENTLEPVRKAYAGDAWDKALNISDWKRVVDERDKLATSSVDVLVKTYKEMQDATKKFTNTNELSAAFGREFKDIQEAQRFIFQRSEEIRLALKAVNRNTSGDFIKGKDTSDNSREAQVKKDTDAATKALEAYYREQERIINDAYMSQQISAIERDRQLSANQQKMKRSFVDLYSVILGETAKYNTDFNKILPGKNLGELAERMGQWGDNLVDGMRQSIAQNETEIQAEAIQLRQIIENAMMEDNIFDKLKQDFQNTLDELLILSRNLGDGMFVGVDDKMAAGLIKSLTDVADEAYNVNEQGLRELLSQNIEYGEWWADNTDAEIAIVLQKLRTYYDDRMELQRRYAQRMQREWQTYYKQSGGEAEYAQNEQAIEGMASKYDAYESMGIRKNYNAERGEIQANAALRGSKVEDEIEYYQDLLKTKTAGSEEYIAIQAVIANKQLELNNIIQQSEIETTNVTLEQWQQRAEALSGWAEMVGDTMGEVWMLEKQANDARARGDEETAKKLEDQAKQSRQNLVKEALNKAIDMAKVWAMELGFKVMYNALAKKSDEDVAASGAKATLKGALAEIIANGFKGAGKEVGSKGMAGLITGAVIIAAAAGLAALAKTAVNNMFPEATEGVSDASASSPKRKLTTGMLTYAEGKYPVLGNDGVVYDAQYAGSNMKTGVYRKPHFGIFAEKQPEMVIDGKTTQRLVLNYPEIYSGIIELSRTGRMGMRTYNDGNTSEFATIASENHNAEMKAMQAIIEANITTMAALTAELKNGISANVNYFGKGGMRDAEQRGGKWAKRNRVK